MIVILGLGVTGLSCLRYLHARGASVTVIDSREQPPLLQAYQKEFSDVPIILGTLPEEIILNASEIIVSPGLSLQLPVLQKAIAKGIPCLGDIELFCREAAIRAPIIAITGSNGKTTLTTLVGQMLQDAGFTARVCGNIGTPVLDMLLEPVPDYYVMELSSFQLETTYSLQAKVAVVLNVTPDHMDRYATVADYCAAKQRIYQSCDIAVLNQDEPEIWQTLSLPAQQVTFSILGEADFMLKDDVLYHKTQRWLDVTALPNQTHYHAQNVLAALAIGTHLGLSKDTMVATMCRFSGLAHRCQKVACFNNIDWFNDSKATNVGATIAAINGLAPLYSDMILILGGDAKGADLSPLKAIVAAHVSQLFLIGAAAPELAQLFEDVVPYQHIDNLTQAVMMASRQAGAHTAVLLSPACASWDMFDNYEQRGNLFIKAVKEYIDEQVSHREA